MGAKIILTYHRIGDVREDYNRIAVKTENFEKHILFLKNNYIVLSLEDLLKYEGEETVVAITFDDGYKSVYKNAWPILRKENIPFAVFVTTGYLDSTKEFWMTDILDMIYNNSCSKDKVFIKYKNYNLEISIHSLFDRYKSYQILRQLMSTIDMETREEILKKLHKQFEKKHSRKDYEIMSTKEILNLSKSLLVTIGAHTVSHPSLGKTYVSNELYEIEKSISKIEELLNRKVKYFAYPFGGKNDYSDRTEEILASMGIESAFSMEGVYYPDENIKFTIPRLYVPDLEIDAFKEYIKNDGRINANNKNRDNLLYIGSMQEDLYLKNDSPLIIWGTGLNADSCYDFLSNRGYKISAFAENDLSKIGTQKNGYDVIGIEEIIEKYHDADVVVRNNHAMEIIEQIQKTEVRSIHWWQ